MSEEVENIYYDYFKLRCKFKIIDDKIIVTTKSGFECILNYEVKSNKIKWWRK